MDDVATPTPLAISFSSCLSVAVATPPIIKDSMFSSIATVVSRIVPPLSPVSVSSTMHCPNERHGWRWELDRSNFGGNIFQS
ncbi:hypothetical protein ACFX2A_007690 [Malus domestica]